MRVLGIEVDEGLIDRWRGWLMPQTQPFAVPRDFADRMGWPDGRAELDFETLDAFELYGTRPDEAIVWLDRSAVRVLAAQVRRRQPTAHLWPSGDVARDRARTVRYVQARRRASHHEEVSESTWDAAASLLPGARRIAGTFSQRSGPNCFGAVMEAAGVAGAAEEWMQLESFDGWLHEHTVPGSADDEIGTVLVWRGFDGAPAHAGVTLGDGWMLHKPSQGWMSPTKVLTVQGGKYSARAPGLRLHRYRLR